MRYVKALLCVFGWTILQVNAQVDNVNFDKLTSNLGLSNNTVYSILEDELGFVWIGTKSGLNRYDGYNFKTFPIPTINNENSTNPTVFSLLIDDNNLIWIGLKDAGLIVYDKENNTFQRFPFDNNSTVDWTTITVKSIYKDSRNWLWIGTFGGGTIVLDDNRQVIFHFCTYCNAEKNERLSNDFVFDFEEDELSNIYIATAGKGLNVFKFKTKSIETIHATDKEDLNSYSKTLCLDDSKTLWIGTEGNGLYAFDLEEREWNIYRTNSTQNSISSNIITNIQLDENGQLWLATDGGGLNQFNQETKQFQRFQYTATQPNSLNTDALYNLHFDKSDNLWIGTFNGGVNILKAIQAPFYTNRQYDLEKKQDLRSVLTVQEDENGRVWLGTDGGGIFYFDINKDNLVLKNATELLRQGSFNDVITCIETNGNKGFWYGSFANGLNYFDYKTKTIQRFVHDDNNSKSLIHNNVWDLEMDKTGGLWIGTLGGGIDYLPKGETTFQHFGNFNNQLTDIQIIDILLDENNQYLWIATESKGLNRLNIKTKKVQQFQANTNAKNTIRSNNIQALFEDKKNIWVITEVGLDKISLKNDSITPLNFNYKFSVGTINSIEEDEQGFLWLSTSTGIHRLNPKDHTIIEFGIEKALENNIFNPKAALELSDGRIVFGGVNGFSVVEPKLLSLNENIAIPVFTDFKLLNESVKIGKHDGRMILNKNLNAKNAEIRLSYKDRSITFEFSTTEFTNPNRNKFAYKLIGFDKKWNYVDANQRSIFYSSLNGGKYQLQIKSANSSGIWNDEIRTIDIIVKPPFWETTWFILMSIIVIISSILWIYRFLLNRQKEVYERQVLEQEQELLKKEQEILQLQNKNLAEEVTNKKAELNASILQVAHKNEFLTVLKKRIRKIKSDADESAAKPLRSVVNIINTELRQEDYWDKFQLIFNQTFQDFIKKLATKHPNLTQNDHRLSCFIKMKLNNREIALILNITLSAVEQAKYRLKKKIDLEKSKSLNEYIQKFEEI
ncbi:MAG: two-component regulator propeller domain-containing protein [Saprospiraceae bacterium]